VGHYACGYGEASDVFGDIERLDDKLCIHPTLIAPLTQFYIEFVAEVARSDVVSGKQAENRERLKMSAILNDEPVRAESQTPIEADLRARPFSVLL